MITDINKLDYIKIIEHLTSDRQRIIDTLLLMREKNLRRKKIKSSWGVEYNIIMIENQVLMYSIVEDYLALWPVEYILVKTGNDKVIYIKLHAILRYQERFLHNNNINSVLQQFLISLFSKDKNKFIIQKGNKEISSVSLRIRDGALLGYCYESAAPNIIRFNTFVSDNEIDLANREDQVLLRLHNEE